MGTATNLVNAQPIAMTSSSEFAELYESHYAAVYRTALRVTGNPADAEDVLQTVFLRVLNQGDRLEYSRMPEAYFRRAAANAAVDLLRRRVTHAEIQLDEAPSPGSKGNARLSSRSVCAARSPLWSRTTRSCFFCGMLRD